MSKAIVGTRKRGRPATGATSIHLRIEPELLFALDLWREKQKTHTSRPEAIRKLVTKGLSSDEQ